MEKSINLQLISKYRTALMGFATLLILLCHAPANGVSMPVLLDRGFRWMGVGVDFFLFFSGLGMYYSLRSTDNLIEWYKRRYLRILVPYLLLAIPYYTFHMIVEGDSWLHYFGNITTFSFWTRHDSAWFVAMLIPLYLLTPLIAKHIDKSSHRWLPTIVLCVVSVFGASIPTTNAIFENIQVCLGHVPSFFVGYWAAKYVLEQKEIQWKYVILMLLLYFVILPLYRPLHVSSNWMMVLPSSIILAALFDNIGGGIIRSMVFLGTISLESYLANVFLPVVFRKTGLFDEIYLIDSRNYLFYAIVILIGVLLAYYSHQLCNKCLRWIDNI